ncbi:hypothetical protein AB0M28_09320 [Streptomyces sp. NPDC051940]|uniref:hypothetical protein n=1 Tax=Streptomyces sp. NPDC051940 TaxID=3155675 RepID=UPI00343B2A01
MAAEAEDTGGGAPVGAVSGGAHPARMPARAVTAGCGAALLVAAALVVAVFSALGTIELQDREAFPGIHDNVAPVVVIMLGVAALLLGAAAVVAWRGLRTGGRVAVALFVLPVLLLIGWRVYAVAPMLHCWDHPRMAQQDDGSYRCYDG